MSHEGGCAERHHKRFSGEPMDSVNGVVPGTTERGEVEVVGQSRRPMPVTVAIRTSG